MSFEHGEPGASLPPQEAHLPTGPTPNEHTLPISKRIGEVFSSAATDYKESEYKLANVAIGLGTVAVQALDRARASVVFVPTIAANVLQETQSPAQAAIAAGATFASWCVAVGGATTEGLKQYPTAVSKFEQNFPGVVGFFEDSLPGLEKPDRTQPPSIARRIGSRVLTGVKRGFTVTGIGTAAYTSTAVAKGKSRKEVHTLNANASVDGGTIVGGAVYGVGTSIVQLSHEHPLLAQQIQDHATNIKLWYGVAGAMMAGQFVSTRYKKWRTKRNASDSTQDA